MAMAAKSHTSRELLLAMGIVSAPEYLERRAASRATWLTWSNVCHSGCAFRAQFVVRAAGAPPSIDRLLQTEQTAYGDILRVDVRWNETRLRGPVLSVAAWLTHAARAFASARLIAKLDDDAYLHTPALETLLLQVLSRAPSPDGIYMGPMSWFHWQPQIFERSGFGWTYTMAWSLGRACRNVTQAEERCQWRGCGACVGPFPFASGYLAILSTALATELTTSDALLADLPRLQAAPSLVTRTGGVQFKVMEDIWLGSLLHRHPTRRPVTFVALSERDDNSLISDGWVSAHTHQSNGCLT